MVSASSKRSGIYRIGKKNKEKEPMQKELADAGVGFMVVEELPRMRVFGAAHWLHPKRAILQICTRAQNERHFWSTLFHEAAHILLHSKKKIYVDTMQHSENPEREKQEEQAEAFVKKHLAKVEGKTRHKDATFSNQENSTFINNLI